MVLPVDAIVLLRSVAEMSRSSSASQAPSRWQWLTWGLFSSVGLSHTTSEIEDWTMEEPEKAEIDHLCSELEGQDSRGAAPMAVLSLDLEIQAWKFGIADQAGEVLQIGGEHAALDVTASREGFTGRGALPYLRLVDVTSEAAQPFFRFAHQPAVTVNYAGDAVVVSVHRMCMFVRPGLIRRLLSLLDGLPRLTLSKWRSFSSARLDSKQSRILSQLPLQMSWPSLSFQLLSPKATLTAQDDLHTVVISAASIEAAWRPREAIQGASPSALLGLDENAFVWEMLEPIIYARWSVIVNRVGIELQSKGEASCILEPITATGNLSVNPSVLEPSLPMLIGDWRLTPVLLSLTPSAAQTLASLTAEAQAMLCTPAPKTASFQSLSSDGVDVLRLDLRVAQDKVCVDLSEIFPASLSHLAPDQKVEMSVSFPRLKAALDGVLEEQEEIPTSLILTSQTAAVHVMQSGPSVRAECSLQSLNLQDLSPYGLRRPGIAHGIPRFGRNVSTKECTVSVLTTGSRLQATASLTCVDGNGYLSEAAGQLHSNKASNTVSFTAESTPGYLALGMDLDHVAVGSTFLVRFFGCLLAPPEMQETNGIASQGSSRVGRVSVTELGMCESVVAFPRRVESTDIADRAALLLAFSDLKAKVTTAHMVGEAGNPVCSNTEVEELRVKAGQMLIPLEEKPEHFVPCCSVTAAELDYGAARALSDVTVGDECQFREVRYEIQVQRVEGFLRESGMENVMVSFAALQRILDEAFPYPAQPELPPQSVFAASFKAEVKLTHLELLLRELGGSDTSPFLLCLRDLDHTLETSRQKQSGQITWGELWLHSLRTVPDMRVMEMRGDGLFDGGTILENPANAAAVPESLEEDESGSVSSSTSWQTAGSNVSASRRTTQVQPFTSEFASVAESKPYVQTGAERELSPFVETASGETSPAPSDQEPVEERDAELDLLVMKCEMCRDGTAIQWALASRGGGDLQVPGMAILINVPYFVELMLRMQKLQESIDMPREEPGVLEFSFRTRQGRFRIEVTELRLKGCDVPSLSQEAVALEPPRLCTELRVDSVDAEWREGQGTVNLDRMELQSSWVRCTDPVLMELPELRKIDPVFSLSRLRAAALSPQNSAMAGPQNPLAVEAEIDSIMLGLSQQKAKALVLLLQPFLQLRPLQASSSVPCVQADASSPALPLPIHSFISRHDVTASLCLPVITCLLEDDCADCSFPLMEASLLEVCSEAECLNGSETVAWELRATPKIQIYNRQSLGWESFLQPTSCILAGQSLLPSGAPSGVEAVTCVSLKLKAEDAVELSLTPSMICTARHLVQSTRPLAEVQASSQALPHVSYWIQNQTGSVVECFQRKNGSNLPFLSLKPDISHPVVLKDGPSKQDPLPEGPVLTWEGTEVRERAEYIAAMREVMRPQELQLSFRLSDQLLPCGPLSPIVPGTRRFSIQSNSALFPVTRDDANPIDRLLNRSVPKKTVLACDVQVRENGSMAVCLRSDFQLRNQTAYRIEVGCWNGEELRPQVTLVQPEEKFWIPIMTVAHGRFAVRPHPAATDRYPLRCAWSQAISLGSLPRGQSCTELRCDPIAGGLKSVWLLVGVDQSASTTVVIQAPVLVRNFLPIPLDVAVSCDHGRTTSLKGKLQPRCSMQGYTIYGEDITTLRLVPTNYPTTDVTPELLHRRDRALGVFLPSGEDLKGTDIQIEIGLGLVPICLKYRREGLAGRYVFEICCQLWIYNCTTTRFAVRSQQRHALAEDVAQREEEDVVPDRWILPFVQSSGMPHVRSGAPVSGLGLQSLLQKGQPEVFRRRSGPSLLQREYRSGRMMAGSVHPSMEIAGEALPHRRPLRLQFRTSGSQAPTGTKYWSESVTLERSGSAVVRCDHPMHATSTSPAFQNAAHFFALTCIPIPNAGEAVALHVLPRYVLHNATSYHFQYRQQSIQMERELPVDMTQSMHWPDVTKPLLVSIRVQEAGWMWSGGLIMDTPGDTMIKLRHRVREETLLVQMDVSLRANGVLLATLMHQPSGFAPYRLDNFTCEKIFVRQCGSGNQEDTLRPYSSSPYAWDEPSGQHKVILEGPGRKLIGQFKMDSVGVESRDVLFPETTDSYTSRLRHLKIIVHAEGPTRVLAVLDEDVHPELPLLETPKTPHRGLLTRPGPSRGLSIRLELPVIGVSLISTEREMLYVRAVDSAFSIQWSTVRCGISFSVGQFQLDTCLRHVTYPVLARGPIAQESWTGIIGTHLNRKALDLNLSLWRQRPGGVLCLESLTVDLSPFALNMEEQSLRPLMEYLKDWIPWDGGEQSFRPSFVLSHDQIPVVQGPKLKIYIEELAVAQCVVNFSFCPSDRRSEATGGSFLQKIISLANFEGAQIRLSPLFLKHPLLSPHAMVAVIARHYTTSLLQELYKVLGSADILGDPVHLVQRLGLGVWLLFANPTYALVKSRWLEPARVIMGCIAGVSSLFSNVILGLSNATAKISLAARKSLILFFQLDVTSSAKTSADLLTVVLERAVGVLSSAATGLDEGGVLGFGKGLLMGLMRLLTQPLALVLELISDLMESISHSLSGMMLQIRLLRVPRHVPPSSPLPPYNARFALGSLILKEIWNGALQGETLHGCFGGLEKDTYFLVTQVYLLTVRLKTPLNPFTHPIVTSSLRLEDIECLRKVGRTVCVFGWMPIKCWRSEALLGRNSPYFGATLQCEDVATSCYMSVMIKVACERAPRRSQRIGNGYGIRLV